MSTIDGTPALEGSRITVFHIAIVCLSLTLTLGAWQYSAQQVEKRNGLRFEAARNQVLALISDRMTKYEDALWAGVAAVESHGGDIGFAEWRTFSENLRIDERYPGINGIGVIHFVAADAMDDYLARQRAGRADFAVYPDVDEPLRMPITYIEPVDINAAAVGLDVAHEVNRRTAALNSRDTGTAQITGPIVLVQDAGRTSGFLFYAPFYRGGVQPDVESRRENILGLVYAPFVVHKLMEGLLAKELRGIRFSIRDAGELIYDEHTADDPLIDPVPMYAQTVSLEAYGRTWVLDMRTDLAFRAENATEKPTMILAAGLMIEGLIVSLLFSMARANKRAIGYADEVTIALRNEKAKLVSTNAELSVKNEELERFAYVASHDLKTPIRGINGLTDMIQEDLEGYLSTPGANPDVATNLERIRDRVLRMEKLTNGILKMSRVGTRDTEDAPVSLAEIVGSLATDLGLDPHQCKLIGGREEVSCDPVNFHSVIENLIGNAIKYHDDRSNLHINVTANAQGDRLTVSVSDNGPGIDPKFHDRIFEVFQALRTGEGAENTGIGLAIVRKAVESHGGTVRLESEPGKGATFTFDWPLRKVDQRGDELGEAA